MKRAMVITMVLGLMLVVAVGVTYAQRGNNGNRPDDAPGTCTQDCTGGQYGQNNQAGQQYGQNNQAGQQHGQNGQAGQKGPGNGINAGLIPMGGPVTAEVEAAMIDGLMDEYHALAVYESIMAEFGEVAPFVNIARAEQQHVNAWLAAFDRYDVTVPDTPVFEVPQFTTLTEACAAAASAEIANFGLYDEMVVIFAEYPDLANLTGNLRDASEFNHLQAFQACAD